MVIDYIMSFAQWFFAVFLGSFDLPRIFDSSFSSHFWMVSESRTPQRHTICGRVYNSRKYEKSHIRFTLDITGLCLAISHLSNKILGARDLSMTSKIKILKLKPYLVTIKCELHRIFSNFVEILFLF